MQQQSTEPGPDMAACISLPSWVGYNFASGCTSEVDNELMVLHRCQCAWQTDSRHDGLLWWN